MLVTRPVTEAVTAAMTPRRRPVGVTWAPGVQAAVFRQAVLLAVLVAVAAVAAPLRAQPAGPVKEQVGAPQAVGAAHTVRIIPEACTRLEGVFTGDAAAPYRLQSVQTSPACRPRGRYVHPAQARPSCAGRWGTSTVTRIPQARCPARQVVVRVWHKPVAQELARDGQGKVRIYLQDAQKQAASGQLRELPEYSAQLEVSGRCG